MRDFPYVPYFLPRGSHFSRGRKYLWFLSRSHLSCSRPDASDASQKLNKVVGAWAGVGPGAGFFFSRISFNREINLRAHLLKVEYIFSLTEPTSSHLGESHSSSLYDRLKPSILIFLFFGEIVPFFNLFF